MRLNQMSIALAIGIIPAVLSLSVVFAGEINKADRQSEKKSSQLTDVQNRPATKEVEKAAQKVPIEPRTSDVSPTQITPTEIQPAEEQIKPLSGPAADEKGRQIKWQIVCTGGACGNNNNAKGLVIQDFLVLCGSAGQTAVGPGSSPSFGVNSGYWQGTLYGFLRGDANGDGVITVADAIYLLNYLFRHGPEPDPYALGDANGDGTIVVGDAIYLLNYLFRGGPAPDGGPIAKGLYSNTRANGR